MTTWAGLGMEIDKLNVKVEELEEVKAIQARSIRELNDELLAIRKVKSVYVSDEQITTLKQEIDDLQIIRRNHYLVIEGLRREVAALRTYKRAVWQLADSWDQLCELFEERP